MKDVFYKKYKALFQETENLYKGRIPHIYELE